ncbi:MAG: hypothetical protein HC819_16585 [Cyclobacteriaceae bacterium]|nr:hypothetical protein [Cyclobacteriaceae bacterium]
MSNSRPYRCGAAADSPFWSPQWTEGQYNVLLLQGTDAGSGWRSHRLFYVVLVLLVNASEKEDSIFLS